MDDLEGTVGCGFEIVRDGDLARTSTVNCAAYECELLRRAKRHGGEAGRWESVSVGSSELAGEVGSTTSGERAVDLVLQRRVVERRCAVWCWSGHFHVGG